LKTISPGGTLSVAVGEVFGVTRDDHGTSGYESRLEVPSDIVRLGDDRHPSEGFGGGTRIVTRFRCKRAGSFKIDFVEGRPWENDPLRRSTAINCR